MNYKITISLDDNKIQEKLALLQEKLSSIDGKPIKIKVESQSLMDSMSKIGMVITGVNNGLQLTQRIFSSLSNAFIKPAADFEALRVRLVSLYQDTEKANEVFEQFKVIAATTPFELRNVVEAGASLKAFGLNAEDTLKSVTDLAAFMGVDVVEAAQSVGRAFAGGAGAADILRERGILTLIKDFKGIDDLTKITLPDFRKAMLETFMDPASGIAGATDRLSQTYVGAMSNMKDALTNFSAEIGSKLTPMLTISARSITRFIESITPLKTELEKVTDETINQQAEFNSLISVYKLLKFEQNETTESNQALKDVIDRLNSQYGTYLGNINLATSSYAEFQKAVSKANDELIREAQLKLINAEKSDLATKVSKVEYERRMKENDLQKDLADLEEKKIKAQNDLIKAQQDYEKAKATGTAHLFSASVEQASRVYAGFEKAVQAKQNKIKAINTESKKEMAEAQKELEEFTRTWADMLNKVTQSGSGNNGISKIKQTTIIGDQIQKDLETIKNSLLDKEALLEKDYVTQKNFIEKNVSNQSEKSTLLKQLEEKFQNELKDLRNSSFEEELKVMETKKELGILSYSELKEKIDEYYNWVKANYSLDSKEYAEALQMKHNADLRYGQDLLSERQKEYEIIKENYKILDEFRSFQYNMDTSPEQRRFDEINRFYDQYKNLLISLGLTEAEIDKQREERLKRVSDGFLLLNQSVESVRASMVNSFSSAFDNILLHGQSFSKSMKNLFKNLVSAIISELTRLLAVKITGLFISALNPVLGGLFGAVTGTMSNHTLTLPGVNFPSVQPSVNNYYNSGAGSSNGGFNYELLANINKKLDKLDKLDVINRNLVNIEPTVFNIKNQSEISPDMIRKFERTKRIMASRGETT